MARRRPHLFVQPYQPGDEDRFIAREDFVRERIAMGWDWKKGPPRGRAWTLYRHHGDFADIAGVGGVYSLGLGYHEAWALLSDLSPREWVVAGQLAAQILEGFETFHEPLAISATARSGLRGGELVLRKLGFEAKGWVTHPHLGDATPYRYMVRAA